MSDDVGDSGGGLVRLVCIAVAGLVTAVGGGMYVYAQATEPEPTSTVAANQAGDRAGDGSGEQAPGPSARVGDAAPSDPSAGRSGADRLPGGITNSFVGGAPNIPGLPGSGGEDGGRESEDESASAGGGAAPGEPADSAERLIDEWSPTIFRLGFSFFVGFAMGYAVKSFFRLFLIIVGVQLFVLMGLESIDWIAVDWDEVRGGYDSFAGWAQGQFSSFGGFVKGAVPSTASAVAGFTIALRK